MKTESQSHFLNESDPDVWHRWITEERTQYNNAAPPAAPAPVRIIQRIRGIFGRWSSSMTLVSLRVSGPSPKSYKILPHSGINRFLKIQIPMTKTASARAHDPRVKYNLLFFKSQGIPSWIWTTEKGRRNNPE